MRRFWMAAMILAAIAAGTCLAAEPAITDLSSRYVDENLVVSLRLQEGLPADRLEEIESGIETVFEYRLQLTRRRVGLPDDVVTRKRVEVIVRRDALARQYTLTRRVDGELAERRATSDPEEMRSFLTTVTDVPLAGRAEIPQAGDLEIRARCDLGLVWRFYLIPWRMTTPWMRAPLTPPPMTDHPEGGRGRRP